MYEMNNYLNHKYLSDTSQCSWKVAKLILFPCQITQQYDSGTSHQGAHRIISLSSSSEKKTEKKFYQHNASKRNWESLFPKRVYWVLPWKLPCYFWITSGWSKDLLYWSNWHTQTNLSPKLQFGAICLKWERSDVPQKEQLRSIYIFGSNETNMIASSITLPGVTKRYDTNFLTLRRRNYVISTWVRKRFISIEIRDLDGKLWGVK
jgi:hypothetical protein